MRFDEQVQAGEQKNPGTAAALSLVPGLGHLYNGEVRKGVLLLDAAAVNFVLLWLILFTGPIVQTLYRFGQVFHLQPNRGLLQALEQAHLGSPLSVICLGLIGGFVAYAARDAYDSALRNRRKRIYPEYVIGLPEATSGSYLFHFAFMCSCCVLACFFLIPQEPTVQVTDIEFLEEPQHKMVPVKSKLITNSDTASGRRNPNRPLSTGPISSAQPPRAPSPPRHSGQPAESSTPPAPPVVKPTPLAHPTVARQLPVVLPVINPRTPAAPSVMPQPTASVSAPGYKVVSPSPQTMSVQAIAPTIPGPSLLATRDRAPFMPPAPTSGIFGRSTAGLPPPSVMPASALRGAAPSNPFPVPISGNSPGRTASKGDIPAPSRVGDSSRAGTPGPALAVMPARTGSGMPVNPASDREGDASNSIGTADFSLYMAELQRRIKRAWSPPKAPQSERVLVIFKIAKNGELLSLRLERSCGNAISDQSALKAVRDAAPFEPLPAHADESIDVQFTFDYNLFGGSGTTFRRF